MSEFQALAEPYTRRYLQGYSKADLLHFVERQPGNWTHRKPYQSARKDLLVAELVKRSNGFAREESPLSEPPPDDDSEEDAAGIQATNGTPKALTLLVHDTRLGAIPKVSISVAVSPHAETTTGSWGATVHDVITALQATATPLNGAVKIYTPDPANPGYDKFIVELSSSALIAATYAGSPDDLLRIENDTVNLRVEAPQATVPPSDQSTNYYPLEVARKRRELIVGNAKTVVEWLQAQIKDFDGYSEFAAAKKRERRNAEAVARWKFISSVADEYAGERSPFKGRITHRDIYKALRIEHATFNAALRCTAVIEKYGEGGSSPDPDVIEKLQDEKGSTTLNHFLHKFAKERGE
ncbi:hypothetical protein HMN09_00131100 [Mycena chlorophos]|uniref:Uncharacterized protein n=1 Tax=Mycena chlorophos TaxID=658473 RepID=A0A8H6WSX0_MYCCL|nr:hypothetical protein HMN09_00131100 [Mycena chlorophos]